MKFKALLLFCLLISFTNPVYSQNQVSISATVGECQNGIVEPNEQCDLTDLNNQTCATLGFFSGTLSCNNDCTFNTSQCFQNPSNTSAGYIIPPISPPDITPEEEFINLCLTRSFLKSFECLFLDPVDVTEKPFLGVRPITTGRPIFALPEQFVPEIVPPTDSTESEADSLLAGDFILYFATQANKLFLLLVSICLMILVYRKTRKYLDYL